jgi:hypothetical protein
MRALTRLPEPQILIERKGLWLANFLTSGKQRPDSSKYAHDSIKIDLNSMSFHKCFYCESKLKGATKEVDHHIEVSVDPSLSFEWTNLNLSCDNCNRKIPHNTISIHDTLNPCTDNDQTIQDHLIFNKELVEPRNNSDRGLRTIKKYRLDSELLDARRLREISVFQDVLLEIRRKQVDENRQVLTVDERNTIDSFKRLDKPYSLMFTVLLGKYGL